MGRGGQVIAATQTQEAAYYHVAASEDRIGIAEAGLVAQRRRFWTEQLSQPQATYLWLQLPDALDYAHERLWRDIHGLDEQANRQARGYDIWICALADNTSVEADPAAEDAVFTTGEVIATRVVTIITRENLIEPESNDEEGS